MSMPGETPLTTLWEMEWEGQSLRCAVYGRGGVLELRVESPAATVVTEPFEMGPRALARVRLLRRSLSRRGWRETRRPLHHTGPPAPAR